MTPAEHLAKARQYARWADELWDLDDTGAAAHAAQIGRLHVDLRRELLLDEHLADLTGPIGAVPDMTTAPAEAPAEATDQNPRRG